MYGIEIVSLAVRLGIHSLAAKSLLDSHHESYTGFCQWSDNALNHCLLHGWQETVFGWRRYLGNGEINSRYCAIFGFKPTLPK
jgi:DNA polymerase I-like protein with 3'-5' exonuclease and polymerase domains